MGEALAQGEGVSVLHCELEGLLVEHCDWLRLAEEEAVGVGRRGVAELQGVGERLALPEGQGEAVGEREGDSEGDSVVLREPERVGVSVAQGEGVSVAHWLAVTLSVPDCVSVAHWLPVALSVGDCVSVAHCEGDGLRVGLTLWLRLTV